MIASAYIFLSTIFFRSSNTFTLTASTRHHKIQGDGSCNFDSNRELMTLLYFSFLPSIILRTYGALKYHKKDPLDFRLFADKLDLIHHASFGAWTLVAMYYYMRISPNCKELVAMSMLNF